MLAPHWRALAVLTFARVSMGFQFQSLASAALPLTREMGLAYADIGFLIGLYMLPGVVLAIPGGALGRWFGDKRAVLFGLGLMIAGGVLQAVAPAYGVLLAGRLVAGIGGVILNVVMTKMVADWFAGRQIVLAMAVFVNSYPVGVGLALLSLSGLAASQGWRTAIGVTPVIASIAFLTVAFAYRSHDNDRPRLATTGRRAPIPTADAVMALLAGALWGLFNGAIVIMLGFAPLLLISRGAASGASGLVAMSVWLFAVSIPLGGVVAERWGRPGTLLVVGLVGSAISQMALPFGPPLPLLILTGIAAGLPVGVIMSLCSRVLRPEHRAVGMGLFYTCMYLGHAGVPPVAGWLRDISGSPAAPVMFEGALYLVMVPLYGAFRLLHARREMTGAT